MLLLPNDAFELGVPYKESAPMWAAAANARSEDFIKKTKGWENSRVISGSSLSMLQVEEGQSAMKSLKQSRIC